MLTLEEAAKVFVLFWFDAPEAEAASSLELFTAFDSLAFLLAAVFG